MDEGAQTVPNFLKKYNPNIVGGSLGNHLGEVSQTLSISNSFDTGVLTYIDCMYI